MNAYLLTLLLLALLSAHAIRQLRTRAGEPLAAQAQRVIARLSWVMLAVFSLEAMSKGSMNIVFTLAMLGYIAIVYALAQLLSAPSQDRFKVIPVAATTFGGGNRGVAMISALAALPVLTPYKDELLAVFVQLDSAVIIWLVTVVPFLMSRSSTHSPQIREAYQSFVSEAGYAPVFIIGVVLFGFMVPQSIKEWLYALLAQTSKERSAILSYLAFTLMFATTSLSARRMGELLNDLWRFYVPRLVIPAVLIGLLAAGFVGTKLLSTSFIAFTVALSVLALCPPSSLFLALLVSHENLAKHNARLADLNVITTFLFLVLALLAAYPTPLIAAFQAIVGMR